MFLIPIRHPDEPFPDTDCWQAYAISADKEGEQCDLWSQVEALDQSYVEDFFAWLLHFQRLCTAHPKGPMKELIRDSKKLHDVGTAQLTTSPGCSTTETVWQFTHGRIRVMWCYAGDGRILILGRVLIKKTQRTKKSDVKVVEKAMQAYLNAKYKGVLKIASGDEDEQVE